MTKLLYKNCLSMLILKYLKWILGGLFIVYLLESHNLLKKINHSNFYCLFVCLLTFSR